MKEIMQWIREQMWKRCRKKRPPRHYPGFAAVQRVGVFFSDQDDSRSLAEVLKSRLEHEGKEVFMLEQLSAKRKKLAEDPPFPSYARGECNLLGEPRSLAAREFLGRPVEVLIDAHPGEHASIGFVQHCANTKLCLSINPQAGEGVEVCLPLAQIRQPHEAADEIVKYLKFINKN